MIKCKKCGRVLEEPTLTWEVVFHGSLVKQGGKFEIKAWGEGDYIRFLTLECDFCDNEAKIRIDGEEITEKYLQMIVEKFTGGVKDEGEKSN